jgi:tetratricopeptide (TPR) repeat protein
MSFRGGAIVVASTLVGLAALPAGAGDNPFLAAGIKLYENLEFETALTQLQRAEKMDGNTPAQIVQVNTYLGLVHAEMGEAEEAKSAFRTALALEARAQVPPRTSPKLAELFEATRKELWPNGPPALKPVEATVAPPPPAREPSVQATPVEPTIASPPTPPATAIAPAVALTSTPPQGARDPGSPTAQTVAPNSSPQSIATDRGPPTPPQAARDPGPPPQPAVPPPTTTVVVTRPPPPPSVVIVPREAPAAPPAGPDIEAASRTITIDVAEPAVREQPKGPSPVPFVLLGLAAAAGGAGGYFGWTARTQNQAAAAAEFQNEAFALAGQAEQSALIANVLYASAGAVAFFGLVGIFTW